jgi:hypothetical protein
VPWEISALVVALISSMPERSSRRNGLPIHNARRSHRPW